MISSTAWIALGLLLAPAGGGHPSNGPDVHLRLEVEDGAVVEEVNMNLAFVDAALSFPRGSRRRVAADEEERLRETLVVFCREHGSVKVDGIPVVPLAGAFEVSGVPLEIAERLPELTATALVKIRLVLRHPLKSEPRSVSLVWRSYPPDPTVIVDGRPAPLKVSVELVERRRSRFVELRRDEPEVVWHAPLDDQEDDGEYMLPVPAPLPEPRRALPLLSVALAALALAALVLALLARRRGRWSWVPIAAAPALIAGALLLSDVLVLEVPDPFAGGRHALAGEEALAVFRPLHANIYRAFDYSRPGDVYDALSRSVRGDHLERLYDQVYRSLVMQDQGGAVSRVERVTPLAERVIASGTFPPDDARGFQVEARWRVRGVVRHWGHAHERTQEYRAVYTVTETAGGFRIAGCRVLEQFRVE